MSDLPLISIIIPIYNVEKFLRKCIDSVLAIKLQEIELILVNDGSTDDSGKICDEYAEIDNRIKVIHKINGGVTAARKTGVTASCGRYIYCVDSDDYIQPSVIEKISNIIKGTEPDVIIFNYESIFPNKRIRNRNKFNEGLYCGEQLCQVRENLIYDKEIVSANMGCVSYSLCDKVIKKEYFSKYQNDVPNEIILGEDLAVCVQVLCNCEKIYFLYDVGYFYVRRNDSAISSYHENELTNKLALCNYLLNSLGKRYENQINVLLFTSIYGYLSKTSKKFIKYKEFALTIKPLMVNEIINRAVSVKIYKPILKDKIKLFLLKHRCWRTIHILAKFKG